MDYSINLLKTERDKLRQEYEIALDQKSKDWDVIVRNERLLEDLTKTIDLLVMYEVLSRDRL
jgi:hypothetical protein